MNRSPADPARTASSLPVMHRLLAVVWGGRL